MTKTLHLVIGGMKCGTTSAYDALASSGVALTPKESSPCDPTMVGLEEARRRLERLFQDAEDVYDVSTRYTMLPLVTGVTQRVEKLEKELNIRVHALYLTRDRRERLQSHLKHDLRRGLQTSPEEALRQDPRYVAFSLYAAQLGPWVSSERVSKIELVKTSEIPSYFRHHGLSNMNSPIPSNTAESDIVVSRLTSRVLSSHIYIDVIRPKIPSKVKSLATLRLRSRTGTEFDFGTLPKDLQSMIEAQFASDETQLNRLIDSGAVRTQGTS